MFAPLKNKWIWIAPAIFELPLIVYPVLYVETVLFEVGLLWALTPVATRLYRGRRWLFSRLTTRQ